ncbi:hypothetical protein CSAL01_00176 [Colletotrichum salicis]|uniref:Uncharacterized protein n=1 Tax=Colletotrichum salicis TaxID=1209931 RepID=A0A135SQV4_9PEZI|nr:hypothetical protein CSAL01_00176 [Colletotrichum salicis]
MWLRRRREQPWPPRTSLMEEASYSATALLSIFLLTTILIAATLMRASSEAGKPITSMVDLLVILILTQTGYAAVFSIHKCILPPPGYMGGQIYFYWAFWVITQLVCVAAVRYAWHRDWSQQTDCVALTWLFSSAGSILLWTYVLVCMTLRRHRRRGTSRYASRPADPEPAVQMVARDRTVDVEAAVSPVQLSPNVAVREVKNENVRLN